MPPPFTVNRDNGCRAKIRLRRRRDYIARIPASLPSRYRRVDISVGARSWFEMPPADRSHRHDRVNSQRLYAISGYTRVDWTRHAVLSAIEQSRGSEYSPETGRKSRLFSATKPFLCFVLELQFAIKSPSRTLSFDARWRPTIHFPLLADTRKRRFHKRNTCLRPTFYVILESKSTVMKIDAIHYFKKNMPYFKITKTLMVRSVAMLNLIRNIINNS